MALRGRIARPLTTKVPRFTKKIRKSCNRMQFGAIIRLRRVLMTLTHLVLAALLVCTVPAVTQDQQLIASQNPDNVAVAANHDSATPSDPWRIMPDRSSNFTTDSMDRMRIDQYVHDQIKGDFRTDRSNEAKRRTLVMGLGGPLDTDATCFTMRSYVVARDSKDSDSTHPTGYSTCQPASKYRVRTTEQGTVVQDR